MSWNSKCPYCDHVNHPDSEVCERCDFPLGTDDDAPPHVYVGGPGARTHAAYAPHDAGYMPAVRFRGAGDVIRPMLELFRKHFLLVITFVVTVTLPEVLLRYSVLNAVALAMGGRYALRGVRPRELLFSAATIPGSISVWLVSLAASSLLGGALVYAVLDLQVAGATNAVACLRRGLKSLPKIFVINLMYTAVIALGYALLIVPGVIFSLSYALVVPAAIAEDLGPFESFKRSSQLTGDYKGIIFVTYFLWSLATVAVGLIVNTSFTYGGQQNSFAAVTAQALVTGILSSTTAVLSVYIFLGLLREKGFALDARAYARETAADER